MKSHLSIDLKTGESVSIDSGRIVVRLEEKSGKRARLSFEADKSVAIKPVRASPVLDMIRRGVSKN